MDIIPFDSDSLLADITLELFNSLNDDDNDDAYIIEEYQNENTIGCSVTKQCKVDLDSDTN
jgi:hypothetical protein